MKPVAHKYRLLFCRSPPVRGRGLKLMPWRVATLIILSPPVRGRGLKRLRFDKFINHCCRPPCGGVD